MYAIRSYYDMITATVRLTYTNNSPDSLPFVWLALDQNRFAPSSRSARGSSARSGFAGGFDILSVSVRQNGKTTRGDYIIEDTRMQVRLPVPMKPRGDKLILTIEYAFPVPPAGMGRSSYNFV